MKAHVRTPLPKNIKNAICAEVEKELERQRNGSTRRIFKLLCVALHEEYKFGSVRCMRIINRITEVAAEHEHDEVYWAHVDRLMEQLGLDFSKENYEELDK